MSFSLYFDRDRVFGEVERLVTKVSQLAVGVGAKNIFPLTTYYNFFFNFTDTTPGNLPIIFLTVDCFWPTKAGKLEC